SAGGRIGKSVPHVQGQAQYLRCAGAADAVRNFDSQAAGRAGHFKNVEAVYQDARLPQIERTGDGVVDSAAGGQVVGIVEVVLKTAAERRAHQLLALAGHQDDADHLTHTLVDVRVAQLAVG